MRRLTIAAAVAAVLLPAIATAQEILLDEFESAAGLILFRSYDEPLEYYYVPNNPRVAIRENGKPDFSFMKYARNVAGEGGEGGIQEAGGGGVVHFLVTYAVPEEQIEEAEQELQSKVEDARIVGPVLFRSGSFALVTTIADEQGRYANKVVGVGKAPLIEGSKAAVSIDLNPTGASLLWESFKMDTPDISIVFDMEISGFRNPYEATMEVDWDQVYNFQDWGIGIKIYCIGADIQSTYEKLQQNGAIKLETKGENASMDAIVQKAHAKLLEIMFTPPEPPESGSSGEMDALSALTSLVRGRSGSGGSTRSSVFSLHGHYKMKNLKRSGKAQFDFNHYSNEKLNIVMAGNIGDLYARFGDDTGVFRATNLDDAVFKQREVFVTVDGRSEQDFTDYINFVTVALRKTHENGEQTVDEVLIDGESFKAQSNRFRMVYGWKDDSDRGKWLRYQYRTIWNFRKGVQVENDWVETDTFVINVVPPYEYRRISLEADPEIFTGQKVRHAMVKFYYNFFGKEIERQETVRVRDGDAITMLEYVCEQGNYDYDYEITWYTRDRGKIESGRMSDSTEILYVDELPESD